MAKQIGANSWARESILGYNLHSEEHELNLMSFPSILHFGPFFPFPKAFSGHLNHLEEDGRQALQRRRRHLAQRQSKRWFFIVWWLAAVLYIRRCTILEMANNMLIG